MKKNMISILMVVLMLSYSMYGEETNICLAESIELSSLISKTNHTVLRETICIKDVNYNPYEKSVANRNVFEVRVCSDNSGEINYVEQGFNIDVDGKLESYTGKEENIIIPEVVKTIGEKAFAENVFIKSVIMENDVTSIGEYAFSGCTNLNNIILSENITAIEKGAFTSCTSLKDIKIPNNVVEIGRGTFANCTTLENITLSNNLNSLASDLFRGCKVLKSIKIPNSILKIGAYVFFECTSLKEIVIPNSVQSIGIETFGECSELTDITLPPDIGFVVGEGYSLGVFGKKTYFNGCNLNLTVHSVSGSSTEAYIVQEGIPFSGLTMEPTAAPTIEPTIEPTETPTIEPSKKPIATTIPIKDRVSIEKTKIVIATKKIYTSNIKNVKPKITVKYKGKILSLSKDYTITYKNNKGFGKGKVIINGEGKYKGKNTLSFYILPKKVTITNYKRVIYQKTQAIKLSWKKQVGATGYQVVYKTSKSGKYKELIRKGTAENSTVFCGNATIYIKVRAYVKINGKNMYGLYSSPKKIIVK